jgi:hypothetical protein
MRYSLIILALILLLAGCAGQKFYSSKGVSYFEQPAVELDGCQKINLQPIAEKEGSIIVPGLPVVYDNVAYYPMQTAFGSGTGSKSYSAVYAYDLKTLAIKDSLKLNPKSANISVKNLVVMNDIYMAGVKDTLLHFVKTDTNLKNLVEYPTNVKIHYVAYTGRYAELLRIVAVDFNKDVYMYDYDTETMQPIRKRLLLKDYMKYSQDGENLWFFADTETTLEAVKINLAAYDPIPVYKTFDYAVKDFSGGRYYTPRAHGDNVYFSYVHKMDETGIYSRLVSFNFTDGTMQSMDYTGPSAFDIAELDGKTYLYRSAEVGKQNALIINELNPGLQLGTEKAKFFISDRQFSGRIVAYNNRQFILTGTYYNPIPGKKVPKDTVPATYLFQPFLAVTGAK